MQTLHLIARTDSINNLLRVTSLDLCICPRQALVELDLSRHLLHKTDTLRVLTVRSATFKTDMAELDKTRISPAAVVRNFSESDRKTFVAGSWLVAAIMLVFSNRHILIDLKFAHPMTLVAWQAFCVLCVTQSFILQVKLSGGVYVEEQQPSWGTYGLYIVPIGALFGLTPLWASIATKLLPTWQIAALHGLTPLIATGLSRLIGTRVSLIKFSYVAVLIIALVVSTLGGMKFGKYDTTLSEKQMYGAAWAGLQSEQLLNTTMSYSGSVMPEGNEQDTIESNVSRAISLAQVTGLACGLLSVIADASSKVLMEYMLKAKTHMVSSSLLVTKVVPVWLLVSLVSALVLEGSNAGALFNLPMAILACNGLAAVVVAYCIPAIIQMTSATTFTLAESFRQTFVTFLGCVIYNVPIGIVHAISFFLGFIGFAKYAEREASVDKWSSPHILHETSDEEADQSSEEITGSMDFKESEKIARKQAETTGATVNLFIVLFGFMLAVLVMASMTTRPVLSAAQALRLEKSTVPYEESKVATIIETRNLPHLGPLILQFLTVLPPDWPIVAWCSPENIEVLRQIPAIARNAEEGRLELRLFPHQFDIHDQEYLSRFLTSPWLWEQLQQEWILFFQSDSMLCSKSPQKIDDWLGFDWVGAPWEDSPNAKGGNGGLSIRKRSSMIKLTTNPDIAREPYGDPEDIWFSRRLQELPGVKWPTEHQAKFSVENLFGAMSEWSWRPLGVHSGGVPPPAWREEDTMNRLMDWCPELKLFYDPRKIG